MIFLSDFVCLVIYPVGPVFWSLVITRPDRIVYISFMDFLFKLCKINRCCLYVEFCLSVYPFAATQLNPQQITPQVLLSLPLLRWSSRSTGRVRIFLCAPWHWLTCSVPRVHSSWEWTLATSISMTPPQMWAASTWTQTPSSSEHHSTFSVVI